MREQARRHRSPSASSSQPSQMSRNMCPPQKRSLNPVVIQELENLGKDADSRKSAFKALKSYVKDLDTKAIPLFLAQVSETKEPGASCGEHTISLYEVLARFHGRNIVPQIGNIMTSIVTTLSSSAGSFQLHQACSKVAPAIARYAIDPSTAADEKIGIIRSLCKPLSDILMGSKESLASGAALCLQALVESDNWRFASDEMVNEVCLKVAGALEENATQTDAHMGLVMALSKHNSLVVEPYARSLLRSGLKILIAGADEVNPQKRYSAIKMIHSLMKYVDSRSIASEIGTVIEAVENCHTDQRLFVRVAAFEALQTAKLVAAQKGSTYGRGSSPISSRNFAKGDYRKWMLSDIEDAETKVGGSSSGFASPESQTIDSFITNDSLVVSPLSIGQSDCDVEYGRRANRRLWNNEIVGIDVSLQDGLLSDYMSGINSSKQHSGDNELGDRVSSINASKQESSDRELADGTITNEDSGTFSGFPQATAQDWMIPGMVSPRRPRSPISINDKELLTTPRRLVRSLQDPDADSGCAKKQPSNVPDTSTSNEVDWNPMKHVAKNSHSHNVDCEIEAKIKNEEMRMLSELKTVQDDEHMIEDSESVSSCGDIPTSSTCNFSDNTIQIEKSDTQRVFMRKGRVWKPLVISVCCLFFVCSTSIMLAQQMYNDQCFFDMVPT